MKTTLLILMAFSFYNSTGQRSSFNEDPNLIGITDSLKVPKGFDNNLLTQAIDRWNEVIKIESEAEKIFNYDGIKSRLILKLRNDSYDKSSLIKARKGEMTFLGSKRSFGQAIPDASTGIVDFIFYSTVKNGMAIYEFSHFEFVSIENELNRETFENEKVTNKNVFETNPLQNNKKLWSDIKAGYLERFKVLSANLKKYVTATLNDVSSENEDASISYKNYKSIHDGMGYEEVVQLLKDEGKETSSAKIKEGSKTVEEKTVIWKGKGSSMITIVFQNDQVYSKSQTGL